MKQQIFILMMLQLTKKQLIELDRIQRMHLINSCTGVKSANLIGTINDKGQTNLAIFNSVSHLGSNPPMITFLLRPKTVERHTYENIISQKSFTINQVSIEHIQQAHQTSAKYPSDVSEFEACGFTADFQEGIIAPFVKESKIQVACEYVNEYHIKEHDCHLIVGEIQLIRFEEGIQHDDGWLDAAKANSAGCIGLDGYVSLNLKDRYAYARPETAIKSLIK